MKFVRQFEPVNKKKQVRNRKSATVQGAVLPVAKIVERLYSGNVFGLSFNPNISYDSDDPDFSPEHVQFIDRCDHLTSISALKGRSQYLSNKIKAKADELAKQKEIESKTDVPAS